MSKHHVGKVCFGPVKDAHFQSCANETRRGNAETAAQRCVLPRTESGWTDRGITAAAVQFTRPRLFSGPENKKRLGERRRYC